MNKTKFFIKTVILLLIILLIFLPKTKININMDITGSAESSIHYITPFIPSFKADAKKTLMENQHQYIFYTDAKMIKKLKLSFHNITDNFTVKVNNIKISLPYLYNYNIKLNDEIGRIYKKDEILQQNNSIIFPKISAILIIIPVILFLVICILIVFLFKEEMKIIKSALLSFIKNNYIITGIFLLLVLFEMLKMEGMSKNSFDSSMQAYLNIFQTDSYILSLFIILLISAVLCKNNIVSVILLFILNIIFFIHIVDIGLIKLLSARLRFTEAGGYIPDALSIGKMILSFIQKPAGIYSIILMVYSISFSIFIVLKRKNYGLNRKHIIILASAAVLFIPFSFIKLADKSYYNTALQESIIRANMPKTDKTKYSSEMVDNIRKNYQLEYRCADGLNLRKNIIIIFMESVSSYKSMLYSGMDNQIPLIDNLSLSNTYIQDYYSNSYNSTQNRFNLLTGLPLITSPDNDRRNLPLYYNNAVPKDFISEGYYVEYINAADIKFDGTINLVENAGIKNIYDAYSSIFDHVKRRYIFNGVEDSMLYSTILSRIKSGSIKQPYLTIATTMSTHGPYEDPVTHELSYDKTLQYADREINKFVNNLKEIGFFNNGILVITSDHRVMLPISRQEYNVLGPLAHAAIPLVIIDGGGHKQIQGPFSHTDLGKSLEYLALNKACFNKFQHNIFTNDNGKSCVIYQQLTNLALVDVKCGSSYGQILLDGDNTRFIKDTLKVSNEYKKEIIDYINYLRVAK